MASRVRLFAKRTLYGTALVSTAAIAWHLYFRPRRLHISAADRKGALEWVPPPRSELIRALSASTPNAPFDLLIIGGGATGVGCALDAASRGLKTACVERADFASGSSSKSTKLIHGGVRYLEKAFKERDAEQYRLVKEALKERAVLLKIAPHITNALPLMLPVYRWYQVPYYWAGSKAYDFLAGSTGLQASRYLSKQEAIEAYPMLQMDRLVGAIVYYDGQMNDARCNLALALTAIQQGAVVTNYTEVVGLLKDANLRLTGAMINDRLTGTSFPVYARGVINATGPYCDHIRFMDDPEAMPIVIPSAGSHIVLPGYYSPASMGLIDPRTSDGRVIFFLPWEGNTIAGTTDAPTELSYEPRASPRDIDFILAEIKAYLGPQIKVRKEDVLAAWSGIRPLIRDPSKTGTGSLVRSHLIDASRSGLITIAGGKWTTYRHMAQETVDKAVATFGLKPAKPKCRTDKLMLIGGHDWTPTAYIRLIQLFGLETDVAKHLSHLYGDRAVDVAAIAEQSNAPGHWPLHGRRLLPHYPHIEAEIRYACRREYAVQAIDVLTRRTSLAFLNCQAAMDAMPRIIAIMAEELGWSSEECNKQRLACQYHLQGMGAGILNSTRAIFSCPQVATYRRMFFSKAGPNGRLSWSDAVELLRNRAITEEAIRAVDRGRMGSLSFADFLEVVEMICGDEAAEDYEERIPATAIEK